jgi:hypothetical protein
VFLVQDSGPASPRVREVVGAEVAKRIDAIRPAETETCVEPQRPLLGQGVPYR